MGEARKTVVIFDDSAVVLEAATEALTARNFVVHAASTVRELDALLVRHAADLVVLDVQTPEVFGDDVGHILRGVRGHAAPVVLFSSLDPAELAERVKAAGLDGFVCKDDGAGALVDKVVELIGASTAAG